MAESEAWEVVRSGGRQTLVVVGASESVRAGELLATLAKDFEVIAVATPPGVAGDALAAQLASLAPSRRALIACGDASPAALHCAAGDAALERLVLIAPDGIARLEDAVALAPIFERISAATLVVFGNDDPRSVAGRHYRAGLRRCAFALVYAAGAEVACERPAALAALIADFIRRGPRFVVPEESQILQP